MHSYSSCYREWTSYNGDGIAVCPSLSELDVAVTTILPHPHRDTVSFIHFTCRVESEKVSITQYLGPRLRLLTSYSSVYHVLPISVLIHRLYASGRIRSVPHSSRDSETVDATCVACAISRIVAIS